MQTSENATCAGTSGIRQDLCGCRCPSDEVGELNDDALARLEKCVTIEWLLSVRLVLITTGMWSRESSTEVVHQTAVGEKGQASGKYPQS